MTPPSKTIKVKDLVEHEMKNKPKSEGKKPFRPIFIPRDMPHESVEAYLEREGYKIASENHRITIQVPPVGLNNLGCCAVVQDGAFNFLEFRYPDVKWVLFNIVRKESERRDVRIAVESIKETTQDSDEGVKKYKKAQILQRNSARDIIVNEDHRSQEVYFVREKLTRKFRKPSADASAVTLEIHLSKTREYSKLNEGTGEFEEIKNWREEVIIHPEIKDIDKLDITGLPKSLIEFCYDFEKEVTTS